MAYTDQEIADYARQLGTKGANPAEIEAFVSSAKAGQSSKAAAPSVSLGVPQTDAQPSGPSALKKVGGAVVDAAVEGLGGALGQAVGSKAGLPGVVVGGMAGATLGNYAGQQRRIATGEQQGIKYGQLFGAGMMGAVPFAPLANAPARSLAATALKFGVANTAAKGVETAVDDKRRISGGEAAQAFGLGAVGPYLGKVLDKGVGAANVLKKQIQSSVMDATLTAARKAGFVIPPSKVNPSFVNNMLESLAGKAATVQEVAIRNQEITNGLARKAVGLPVNAPITEAALRGVREKAASPYREIESLARQAESDLAALQKSKFTAADAHELAVQMADPATVKEASSLAIKAGADVNALKKARFDATSNYQYYNRSGDPKALEAAKSASTLADELEEKIENAAVELGRPELAKELKAARVRIAKAYEIEKALNIGDSNVSAPILGRSIDKGTKLTGGLETAAKFQQAFPQAMREAAAVPAPGVSKMRLLSAGAMGAAGYGGMGPKGMALAAVPFMEGPARSLILSDTYQNLMAKPRYGTAQADFLARFGRNSTAAGGRNDFLKFLSEAYPAKQ